MNPPPPPPPQQNTTNLFNNDKEAQARVFKAEALKTRNFIFAIAALYFFGNLVTVAIAGAFTGVYIAAILLFPLIFTGLGFLAPMQPLVAIIISGVVVLLILIILVSVGGGSSWSGWLYFAIAAGLTAAGAMSANKAEQARKLMR